jgi:asparagine synthase (glutamine-hydrolysing)
MCGICGIAISEGVVPVDDLHRMNTLLRHRGPDEEGYHLGSHVGLAHRRLSIIDLSTGQQPIYNERRNLCIVFNGEIYNYRELKKDLLANGHKFTTNSDTEVILHLFEDKETDCLRFLRGMFAFAIWNEDSKNLFLARDRVGKKPLYYAEVPHGIIFASEMKSLLVHPKVSRQIDFDGFFNFITLSYIPAPRTILRGVSKLESGHFLIWKDGRIIKHRYWTLDYEPKLKVSEQEAIEGVRDRLDDAVKVRLESEVPLGCLLSGGIDSATVAANMRRHVTGDLHTFSIGFEEEDYNELALARLVAERLETRHEELVVKPNAIEVLPKIVWHFDEPFGDSSAIPTYYVAKMARKRVTVVLNGDGGDESFFGYTRYLPQNTADVMSRWKMIPGFIRRVFIGPLASELHNLFPYSPVFQRLYFGNQFSLMGPNETYVYGMLLFTPQMMKLIGGEAVPKDLRGKDYTSFMSDYMKDGSPLSYYDKMIRNDVMTYLPGDLLVKMDRMTMANSLEARSPFLDHILMEYAARLPIEIKFKDFSLKSLLKNALRGIVPDQILDGKKHGFTLPIERWLKQDLQSFSKEILLSPETLRRGLINHRYVRQIIRDHEIGRRAYHHLIWALLNLEIWCRTFLDRTDLSMGPITM